ncbi:MAG TPA: flagellar basal-body MS-ring/collar protein FliF [Bryobacteraceae bacterium]|nr:flagellar basal-body MS-ring/collar protein FliF [Bryobacteraceae bacterium]
MKKILASLSIRQRITIAMAAVLVMAGISSLVHWRHEADFRPLFTGLAPEDAAAIVQKLKESGVDYRVPETGGSVLVPSDRLAELRLNMAAQGLPKTGRVGFELFDKANLGATEFTEHVNFERALEGELERSVMSLAEVDQARVHITFPKDSVYLDAQQPAKASVLVHLRPGAHLTPQNVQAIDHLVASAVEGLSPDGVSVLDMNGNLLGRPRSPGPLDGSEPSEGVLDYRHKVEGDLVAKINSTLDPLLGPEKFRAGVSVDCDFSGGEQSEEVYDPTHSVMVSSQRSEDTAGGSTPGGIPGTASALPRPAPRPATGSNRVSHMTENITYETSRTVKKTHLPAGTIRKISVSVLVDQAVTWQKQKNGYQRVLVPPTPEKLKIIRDLVAGVTGFNADRGDQIVVETLPFETTLMLEPPPSGPAPAKPTSGFTWPPKFDRNTLLTGGAILAILIVLGFVAAIFLRRGTKTAAPEVTGPAALPAAEEAARSAVAPPADIGRQLESELAQREARQQELDSQALQNLKLAPVITKTAEVLARHLKEKIKKDPEVSAHILRTWIREEET